MVCLFRNAVYFAVNPSLGMFQGFASYCRTNGTISKTQLSPISSYAPIRVWEVDAYVFCPRGDDGRLECTPGKGVRSARIPNAFTDTSTSVFSLDQCYRQFSVHVSSIEYLNEENVAITVLNASFVDFNPETGR